MSKRLRMCPKTVIFGRRKKRPQVWKNICVMEQLAEKCSFVLSKSDLKCTWQSNRFVYELTNA